MVPVASVATGRARVWLVTGASSGFGRAVATAAVELDVTDAAGKAVVDGVVERHGRLDVLVNAAGRALVGAVEETTDGELRDLMDVHFSGPVALTRAALPHLRAQGGGAIVQFTSLGGRLSFPGVGAYSATKFALEGWSEGLASEVGPLGIRVLIVDARRRRDHGVHGVERRRAPRLGARRPWYRSVNLSDAAPCAPASSRPAAPAARSGR